jgi:2-iminobutanoate/2-iminopropanoate deaminase
MTDLPGATSLDLLTTPGHYKKWVRAGDFIYTAGLTPRGPQRQVIGQDIREQTVAVLSILDDVLGESGTKREDIVKATVYLADLSLMDEFNVAYAEEMGAAKPARTTVGCELNGVLIEIDVIAFKTQK